MEKSYTLSKELTNTKIKALAKTDLTEWIINKLKEEFGEDSVAIVRTGSGQSFSNEIGVIIGSVDVNGTENQLVATLSPTIKEFENRSTAKKVYTAFDFAEAKECYDNYLNSKDEKKSKDNTVISRK